MTNHQTLMWECNGTEVRVIVAGTRVFKDYEYLCYVCDQCLRQYKSMGVPITIISGTANGADKLGELYAESRGYNIVRFPADWNSHGKSAGPIRNNEMAKYARVSKFNALIAFWDGESRGTSSMISLAELYKIPSVVVNYKTRSIDIK